MKKMNVLFFSLLVTSLMFAMETGSTSQETWSMEINALSAEHKQELTQEIKYDIYKIFCQEKGIKSKSFNHISRDNSRLEDDLNSLYKFFNSSENTAQQKLTAFCTKWHLENIQIRSNNSEEYQNF
jgi:hypothetical protein